MKDKRIEFLPYIKEHGKEPISTLDMVKEIAGRYRMPQTTVKAIFENFLNSPEAKDVSKERTPAIFLKIREQRICPMYQDAYISHVSYKKQSEGKFVEINSAVLVLQNVLGELAVTGADVILENYKNKLQKLGKI